MAIFPRVILVGVSALALAGGTALGLTGVTSSSAAPPKERGTVQVQTVADHNAGAVDAALADEAHAAGGEPDAPVLEAAAKIAKVTRDEVIARAKTWHPHTSQRVPYSQHRTHGGYRTDCSGYASMALRLPKPGPNTVQLATSTYTSPIAMSQLQKGDLVIDAIGDGNHRHVVIFEKWNKAHTAYSAYEQRGGYGTDHRTLTYGLAKGSQYHARRPKNIIA